MMIPYKLHFFQLLEPYVHTSAFHSELKNSEKNAVNIV